VTNYLDKYLGLNTGTGNNKKSKRPVAEWMKGPLMGRLSKRANPEGQ